MALTWIDWLLIGLLTFTSAVGLVRGLVREALGLVVWVVALLAARMLAQPLADLLAGMIESADARLLVAFIVVIFAVMLLGGLVIRLIHAVVEWAGMGVFNRVAGAAFGAAKGAAIAVLAAVVIGLTPLAQLEAWQKAETRPYIERLRDWAVTRFEAWEEHLPSADSLREISPPGRDEPERDAAAPVE